MALRRPTVISSSWVPRKTAEVLRYHSLVNPMTMFFGLSFQSFHPHPVHRPAPLLHHPRQVPRPRLQVPRPLPVHPMHHLLQIHPLAMTAFKTRMRQTLTVGVLSARNVLMANCASSALTVKMMCVFPMCVLRQAALMV